MLRRYLGGKVAIGLSETLRYLICFKNALRVLTGAFWVPDDFREGRDSAGLRYTTAQSPRAIAYGPPRTRGLLMALVFRLPGGLLMAPLAS